jgi:hypothetical protein
MALNLAPTSGRPTGRSITYNMLLSSATLTKSSKESTDAYLQRVTHFHLQNKKIGEIAGLEVCTNLKVISVNSIAVLLISI